jgi:hypothetical protein
MIYTSQARAVAGIMFAILLCCGVGLSAYAQSGSVISPENRKPAPNILRIDDEGSSRLAQSGGGDPKTFSEGLDQIKTVADTNKLSEGRSAKEILQSIVKWLLSLVGTVAVISLLYGGFLYITSQGDEGKAEQAKTIILYSVIGIVVIGISAIVVNVVISITTT